MTRNELHFGGGYVRSQQNFPSVADWADATVEDANIASEMMSDRMIATHAMVAPVPRWVEFASVSESKNVWNIWKS
jgi:hypothetical protein